MKLAGLAWGLLLVASIGGAQPAPSKAPPPDEPEDAKTQALRRDLSSLRREVEALTRRIEALTQAIADLSTQVVLDYPINRVTDPFAGSQSGMQPQVIAAYPGRLVSASVTLVRTERAGGYEGTVNGRSVTITPGGYAAIPVEGAGTVCNWIVYDEANAIKVRSEACGYVEPGLRGHFTGSAYYRNGR